jgi:hypothetical protein
MFAAPPCPPLTHIKPHHFHLYQIQKSLSHQSHSQSNQQLNILARPALPLEKAKWYLIPLPTVLQLVFSSANLFMETQPSYTTKNWVNKGPVGTRADQAVIAPTQTHVENKLSKEVRDGLNAYKEKKDAAKKTHNGNVLG